MLAVESPAVHLLPERPAWIPPARRSWPWESILTVAVLAAGIALRTVHWAAFRGMGFDEALYRNYLRELIRGGLGSYPDIVDGYLAFQKTIPGSILPPTRFLYILCAYGWHGLFGTEPLACFYAVSRVFGIGTLLVAGGFARRLFADRRLALATVALMAFSPLQIHLAQHALVDGFFEFWALLTLWALWEVLQQPGHRGWLATYTAGLALMVTTKENAFFVFVAILAILAANRFLRFGTVTRALLALTFAGPLIGVAILTNVAGGLGTLIEVYRLGVPKNLHLEYAIATGDGPWYRYLLDLLTISPVVFLLGVGMIWQLRGRREDRPLWFLVLFVAASYVLMANVKYGMNLRYASIWDLPLRALAAAQLGLLVARADERWRGTMLAVAVAVLGAFDVNQYYRLAVKFPLYELVPQDLLRALDILK